MSEWNEVIFSEVIKVNPREKISKGYQAPYIGMAALREFQRQVNSVYLRQYKGSGSRFKNGDTLLARITPCLENGKTAFVDVLNGEQIGWGSTEFIVLRGKKSLTDNLFVYYLARREDFREYAIKNMTGTSGRQRVDISCLDRFTIPLPPLPTQRRIAEVLGRLDDKIELNRRINRTLEAMAQTLYQHHFVQFGPYQDGPFVESELGLIPKGWGVRKLKEVAKINPNSIRKGTEPDDIIYVDISSVSTGRIDEYTPMSFSDAPTRARRLVRHGDTIIASVRPNRRSFSLIQYPPENLVVSTGFGVIRPTKIPFAYLYYTVERQEFTDYLTKIATGAAYPAVNQNGFKNTPILVPDIDTLNKFHNSVQSWLELKANLELENRHLAEVRDYLLPKLLSGEVRG